MISTLWYGSRFTLSALHALHLPPCPVTERDPVLYLCNADTMLHVSSASAPERVPHCGSAPWLRLLPSKQLDSAPSFLRLSRQLRQRQETSPALCTFYVEGRLSSYNSFNPSIQLLPLNKIDILNLWRFFTRIWYLYQRYMYNLYYLLWFKTIGGVIINVSKLCISIKHCIEACHRASPSSAPALSALQTHQTKIYLIYCMH